MSSTNTPSTSPGTAGARVANEVASWSEAELDARVAASLAAAKLTRTECPDCGGPVRQAFATTTAYVSCRRCGHVHTAELSA